MVPKNKSRIEIEGDPEGLVTITINHPNGDFSIFEKSPGSNRLALIDSRKSS